MIRSRTSDKVVLRVAVLSLTAHVTPSDNGALFADLDLARVKHGHLGGELRVAVRRAEGAGRGAQSKIEFIIHIKNTGV